MGATLEPACDDEDGCPAVSTASRLPAKAATAAAAVSAGAESSGGVGAGTWLFSIEEMRAEAAVQIGQSACGPTAVLNILRGCGTTSEALPSPQEVLATTPARQRDYRTPSLSEYLLSRARAGTIHSDLIAGVDALSLGEITGQLFAVDQFASPRELSSWLEEWLCLGAVPMLTLNLFLMGKDAYHHQTVFGVEEGGDVWATNPVQKYSPTHLLSLLTGSRSMVIPRQHILERFQRACLAGSHESFISEAASLDKSPGWDQFQVGSQITRILGEALHHGDPEAAGGRPLNRFQDLVIPWGGLPGVTVFARRGSPAHEKLRAAADAGQDMAKINLPLYNTTEWVPVALRPRGREQQAAPCQRGPMYNTG
mmetsp:Transcript_35570/g.100694  ORF Transcript_35570/g.100694 Transcript_35570/m.100694 type:complete len:368 (-) Transcript_35570:168-1271(-)